MVSTTTLETAFGATPVTTPLVPAAGASCYHRSGQLAPNLWVQGTGLSVAGSAALSTPALVAFGARVIDLPGSPPRGAPV